MIVILGREDRFITGLVLDKHKKQVIQPGYGLRFRGSVQLKFNLEYTINIL